MIATALLVSNMDEVLKSQEEVKRLGIGEVAKPKYIESEFCFPLNACTFAFRNNEGNIKTIIAGQEVVFKYDESLWNRLKEHFKHI
jgi:hypothetical protein